MDLPNQIKLILFLCLAMPVAWLASEFQARRGLRIALGCCAIGMCYAVAAGVGSFERFNSKAWYGSASKGLIDTTLLELEAGNTGKVIEALKSLHSKFEPTYENRARYDHLVNEYIVRLGHRPEERLGPTDPLSRKDARAMESKP
ncbi:hypothetical protein Pan44_20770 [Caulifigura coniformis]|uniref:Uncharacterized protein n=1 Tax=Caulifigura coniformis TaxID=2527983 RepID=A0A517SD49_9PLAN|nr:hypothetical protein [Caulifigura coniformis]QDT54050.1 hypothetical protein Pan44_20770 [Caulifigura coniformis]